MIRYKASCKCREDRLWGLVKRKKKLICKWCNTPLEYKRIVINKKKN